MHQHSKTRMMMHTIYIKDLILKSEKITNQSLFLFLLSPL